jgi:membrane-associated phospholipid phosphatase
MNRHAARGLVVAFALVIARGAAADPAHPPSRRHLIEHGAATGAGGLVWILSETVFKPSLAPASCRWCDPLPFDRTVRDSLVWRHHAEAADTLSNLGAFVLMPAIPIAVIVAEGVDARDAIDDGLAVAESGVATALLDQVVKFTVGRGRPLVYFGLPDRVHDIDDDVSFYSGHTSLAFALATSAGTVASRRHLRAAPWVWGMGLGAAATTGYLRIAADKHYTSDVLIGAIMGTAAGSLIPRLFHDHDLTVVPAPGGLAVLGTF